MLTAPVVAEAASWATCARCERPYEGHTCGRYVASVRGAPASKTSDGVSARSAAQMRQPEMSVGTVIVRKSLDLGPTGFMLWGSVVSGSVSTSSTYRGFSKRVLVFEGRASGLFDLPTREPELHGARVDTALEGTEIVLLFQSSGSWPGLSFEDRLEAYEETVREEPEPKTSGGLQFHATRWNTGHSSTADLERAAIEYARSVGPVSEQDARDLQRCVDFRVKELKYATEPRHARYLEILGLTGEEAWAEIDRLTLLKQRLV